MPRQYTVTFEGVAVTAAQDLFQLNGAAGKLVEPVRVVVKNTDTTLPSEQMLQFRIRYLPATVTNGSGGTTPTITKVDPGDAAASFTALVNNTTKATTSGTAAILYEGGEDIRLGLDETFDGTLLRQPEIGPSEALVVELLAAPSGTVHLSGTLWVVERGG